MLYSRINHAYMLLEDIWMIYLTGDNWAVVNTLAGERYLDLHESYNSSRGPLASKETSSTSNTSAEFAGMTEPNPREPYAI